MTTKSEELIIIKIAIALRVLHQRNKEDQIGITDSKERVNSYEKIALNSAGEMRKATVTSAFDGKTRSAMTTIILIVEAMGFTMIDFGETYSNISDKEVSEFKEKIIANKHEKPF
ncbi:hypothetical protein MVI27_08720 [Chryseobacterium salipaludis]|uniref:hypothetical protein n=1 Tax=Chryseobacterium TaxID=59732 RepID=UPI001FF6072E|nr:MULTISPECIES: hypothetical protein [Chryseobacterium]MCJ8498342.1 hypothetical protein [Chryseobacterium salipaludis]MCX3297412.1 hypothetical protein [Planobacterium sp. JC490]